MYILDTCILNILFFYPAKRATVERNIQRVGKSNVWISAISLHELIIVGACSQNPHNMNKPNAIKGLRFLSELIAKITTFQILHYTEADEKRFREISSTAKREGPQDCRIAASALSQHRAVVIIEDEKAFELAGVQCEDWTKS